MDAVIEAINIHRVGKWVSYDCEIKVDNAWSRHVVTLYMRNVEGSLEPQPWQTDYRVQITTSNINGAATDANVYARFQGAQGQTRAIRLAPVKNR